jgi:uncharacterized membrane protein
VSIPEFFSGLNLYMTVFFVMTVALILIYEYNLHHRVKNEAH